MLFLILLSIFLAAAVDSAQVEQCSKLHIQQNATFGAQYQVKYTYDVDVNVVKSVSTPYMNDLQFLNYKHWSADENAFKQAMPLQYWDGNEGVMIHCPDIQAACTITVPDGVGLLELPIFVNGRNEFPDLIDDLFFDNGIVFIGYEGLFFNSKERNCIGLEEYSMNDPNYLFMTDICCREFTQITVPDSNDNPCVEFDSTTVFASNTSSSTIISNFSAHYVVQQNAVNVQITSYYGPPTANYYFSPNEDLTYCAANVSGCTFVQQLAVEDFQFDFLLDVWDPYPQTFHYDTIAGQLIRRNGVYMKEENLPFSPDNRCWNRVQPANNASTATSSFCCTRFKNDPTTLACPQYQSKSVVYQDNDKVTELDVTFTVAHFDLDVFITNYTCPAPSSAQFEVFGAGGFSEVCRTARYTPADCPFTYTEKATYEFEFRTSIYDEGFNMTAVVISGGQFQTPSLSASNLCQTFDNPYKGLDQSITSKTQLCCITQFGGPWPGSSL